MPKHNAQSEYHSQIVPPTGLAASTAMPKTAKKLDYGAISSGLGTALNAAALALMKDPETPFNPIQSSGMGAAPIEGGDLRLEGLQPRQIAVNPYQSAIASLLRG